MPTEQQKKKTAQTLLQTAQDPSNPSNMARILGVAGEGLADFASKAYENLVPQSVEELALEGSPAGAAIGKAIGLIPPKYIQPFVKRLRTMIENEKGWTPEVQQAAWEAVDRNPRIAAHVDTVRPIIRPGSGVEQPIMGYDKLGPEVLGDYAGLDKGLREAYEHESPGGLGGYLNNRLDNNLGAGLGATIRLDPNRVTYGGTFTPTGKVADHEMTHAAQDLWNPEALGPNQRYQTYDYDVNPFEIGANATADSGGGNYWARIERQLNTPEVFHAMGTSARAKMLRDMNRTMANQGRVIVLDPKSKLLKVVLDR